MTCCGKAMKQEGQKLVCSVCGSWFESGVTSYDDWAPGPVVPRIPHQRTPEASS